MAKNRNKKKTTKGAVSMDTSEPTVSDFQQPMDTTESGAKNSTTLGIASRKMKKGGRPTTRSMNVRKLKALEKAVSKSEQKAEKISKTETKVARTQSAKLLYD